MSVKCRRRLLLVSPFVLTLGAYLFLLAANYYYAQRAAYVLHRIRLLKIDNSSIAEFKRVGSEHGLRYEETEAGNCVNIACFHTVSPNNHWMWWWFLESSTMAAVGRRVGLRPWFALGDIQIENGQVIGKVYDLKFYGIHAYPDVAVTAWERHN